MHAMDMCARTGNMLSKVLRVVACVCVQKPKKRGRKKTEAESSSEEEEESESERDDNDCDEDEAELMDYISKITVSTKFQVNTM